MCVLVARDSNSENKLLLPPANWCPPFASRTTQDGWFYDPAEPRWFDPPCDDPVSLHPTNLGQGLCSGEWLTKVTTYDQLRVPKVVPGEYVLGFRWDCESSAQIWQSCADITITA